MKNITEKKLSFNCTRTRHQAKKCKSVCQICNWKHHTSICFKQENKADPLLVATETQTVQVPNPVFIVEVGVMKCQALLDTGRGSYTSAALLDQISSPKRKKSGRSRCHWARINKRSESSDLNRKFSMPVELT